MKKSFLVLFLFLLALAAPAARANTVYISQSGGTFSGGSACNGQTTQTASYFNTSSNWTGGNPTGNQIGPGTVVYLCGTITFAAGTTGLTFQGSGASGSPVTLEFDQGAVLQAPYFASSNGGTAAGAINMSSFATPHSNLVVDGGVNGTIQNTANCTTCANQQNTTGVSAFNCTACTIQNLNIVNMFVRAQNDTPPGGSFAQTAVRAIDFNSKGVVVQNNVMHDCGWCINYAYNTDASSTINGNVIYNFDHAIAVYGSNGNTSDGLTISNNYIHDSANWDAASCPYHHDGLHIFGVNSGSLNSLSNYTVFNNYFTGNWGGCLTGAVFVEAGTSDAQAQNGSWYNNVFVLQTSAPVFNGVFGLFSGHSSSNGGTQVYNNTCLYTNTTDGSQCYSISNIKGLKFKNNVSHKVNNHVSISSSTISAGDLDYNFYGSGCGGGNCFNWNGAYQGTFAAWKTACSCDSNGLQNDSPLLNSDGSPQSGSPLIGSGANLSSIATGSLASLQSDTTKGNTRTPNVRPSTGAWDDAAYEFTAGFPAPSPPALYLVASYKRLPCPALRFPAAQRTDPTQMQRRAPGASLVILTSLGRPALNSGE